MNACYYLLEANAYLLAFYALYKLALQKETFYMFNRWYLLSTSLVSFAMPAISLSSLRPTTETVYGVYGVVNEAPGWTLEDGIILLYLICAAAFLTRLTIKLYSIYRLVKQGKAKSNNGINVVWIKDKNLSFSFLNYLFIHPEAPKADLIIRHEQVHIRQLHSADVLWFELLQILNWFNPFIYYMRKDIKALHEFIADEVASAYEQSTGDYALFLIRYSYGAAHKELGNSMFNKSLLKSRIMKLNQKKSPGIARIKYALALLLLPVMVCTTALAFTKSYGLIDLMPAGNLMVQDTLKKKAVLPPPPPQQPATKTIPPPPPPEPPRAKKIPPPPPTEPSHVKKTAAPKPGVKQFQYPPAPARKNISESKSNPPKPGVTQLRFPPPVVVPNNESKNIPGSKSNPPKPEVKQLRFPPPVVVPKDAISLKSDTKLKDILIGKELKTAADGSKYVELEIEGYGTTDGKVDGKPARMRLEFRKERKPFREIDDATTIKPGTEAFEKYKSIQVNPAEATKSLPAGNTYKPAADTKVSPNKVLNIRYSKTFTSRNYNIEPTGLVKKWLNQD